MKAFRYLLIAVPASVVACISTVTPHDNFVSLMNHNFGSSLDAPRVSGSTHPKYLITTRSLPDGQAENEYRGRGTCKKFFQFDPKTRIITGFRFEGSDSDCAIVP